MELLRAGAMSTDMVATLSNGNSPTQASFSEIYAPQLLISNRVNKDGQFVYIKYHFIADHGQKQFTWPEAIRMSGKSSPQL